MKRCGGCKQEKPLNEFYKRKASPDGRADWCKECQKKYHRDHWRNDPAYREKKAACSRRHAPAKRLKPYGITVGQFDKMYLGQRGKCAVCGEAVGYDEVCVDHNHVNGRVRGLVHRKCNTFVGFVENNLDLLCDIYNYLGWADA